MYFIGFVRRQGDSTLLLIQNFYKNEKNIFFDRSIMRPVVCIMFDI